MGRLFGTDGVRGLANEVLTPQLALALAESAARVLSPTDRRPRAVIARDGRASGEFLAAAVAAGLASAGVDVDDVGVIPTPGVAFLTDDPNVDFGVMLSASHNPMPDNGIKFFARGGVKLPDEVEDRIEAGLDAQWQRPVGAAVGRIAFDSGIAVEEYVEHLAASIDVSLAGLRIVVDCANGAASIVGPEALRKAGADVVVINASPDGRNINEKCGSTHPEQLQAAVVAAEADMGVAFDGDADRCLAVDHRGVLVDGDQIMAILAIDMAQRGVLPANTLVATVMSNLGLHIALQAAGLKVVTTQVGDRYVLEEMLANGYGLGGEQSGHLILAQHATTGDGVLSALHVAARVVSSGRRLEELAAVVRILPQVLINVKGVDKARVDRDEGVLRAVQTATAELGDTGRVLLRSSGTEPVVRVMVEAATDEQAHEVAQRLAGVVSSRLAL